MEVRPHQERFCHREEKRVGGKTCLCTQCFHAALFLNFKSSGSVTGNGMDI